MFTTQDRDFLMEIQNTNPEIYDFITHLQEEQAYDIRVGCHDICNTISVIFGNFQLIELTNPLLKNSSRWKQIKNDVHYLVHTMEGISTYRYARKINPVMTNVQTFMTRLMAFTANNIKYSSLHLQFNTASSTMEILMDTEKVTYIINSILDNLTEVTPNAYVTISTECTDTNFCINVSDNVSIIPDEIRENLFQPFITNKQQHVGLSLATSYQIMLAHNGSLDYIADPDRGHTFVLNFKR